MDSASEKQPLLVAADPELQLAFRQLAARQADRRRRVARRAKLAVVAVALFFFFSYTSGFGICSALSSIIPGRASPSPDPLPGNAGSSAATPLEGPLVLPDAPQCNIYNGGSGLKTYPLASYALVFDGQHSFSLRQNASRHDDQYHSHWRYVRVSGEVVVRKAAAGKAPSVDVEALSNDDRIVAAYAYVDADQSLSVIVDDRILVDDDPHVLGAPCLVVRATVWLPGGQSDAAHLENLLVANTHLGIKLLDDVSLVVDESARLTSVVGSIVASRALQAQKKHHWFGQSQLEADVDTAAVSAFGPDYRFEARATDVETTSGSISGPWTLLNRLHFGSVSGSVAVAVAPEALAGDEVADLSFKSTSGSIGFEEIARDSSSSTVHPHTLSADSKSGSVHGTGSFARSARLHSTSGSTKVTLQPVALAENAADGGAGKAVLESKAVSGSTDITLLDEATGKPLDFLKSVHTSLSGSVRLHYPASWAGGIHLQSRAGGSLSVEGKGVHVQPDRKPRWPPRAQRSIDAVKDVPAGDGAVHAELSNVQAEAVSGSVRLDFPN